MGEDEGVVEQSPGNGWLARRRAAVLWSPGETRPDVLLGPFLGASDAEATRAAVTAAVVQAGLDVPAFALVTWSPHLHVVVMGDVDVETDAPSLPHLSGATSRTWVEHGVPDAADVVVRAGVAPVDGTDLASGVVRAGGFRLTAAPRLAAPQPAETGARPAEQPPDPEPGPTPATVPPERAALLDLVTGGDWMEDSIGLAAPGSLLADDDADPAPPSVPDTAASAAPTVTARHCPSGHPNPPSRPTCRRCGDLVDLAAPLVDVAQPVLADLACDDGATVPLVGTVIVGRQPDPGAAGLDDDAADRLALPERAGVSRTHLAIRADGWTITVTDCGSRRGTELAREGGAPVRLEPWTTHEVHVGDELFLGGPTSVRLVEPSGAEGDSSPSSP